MAAKLFLNEQELRNLGVGEPNIATLRKLVQQANVQSQIDAATADINANASSIAELNANDAVLDGRLDTLEANGPYVKQNLHAAPAFTPYAGQTVSAAYVQAEAQATDDAAKANSIAIAAIITALQAANVLT